MAMKLFDADEITRRFGLFADGDAGDAGAGGGDAGKGAADTGKTADASGDAGKTADAGKTGDAAKTGAADWRATIQDEKLREHAARFNSLDDLVKGNADLRAERDRLRSTAIVPPGKDAKPEEIAEYHKKIGVPEKPDGYLAAFPQPEKGKELAPEEVAGRTKWAERFHALNVPAETATALVKAVNEDAAAQLAAQAAADENFAKESDATLRKEWGGDYDTNKAFAQRAAQHLFGDDIEAARNIEDKTGRFVLDNPTFLKALAKIGREMGEDRLGGTVSDSQRSTIQEQIDGLRKQISDAQAKGDNRKANELYTQEQALIAKLNGTQPVVGAQGRAA